jgi:glucose/mannose-6-phosphate isomerase
MTELDGVTSVSSLDPQGMFGHVAALAEQCRAAWTAAQRFKLPDHYRDAIRVVIAGMGGSAIGGDLAAAAVAHSSPIPILVNRDYQLPAFADRTTLVIASSYSGNTEEVLAAFEDARGRGCLLAAVSTGGKLARLAENWDIPIVSFDYRSQPRAALGYMFVSTLGILNAMGIAGDMAADLEEAITVLEAQGLTLAPESAQMQNPAKQLAAWLAGYVPIVIGTEFLGPVARRWKTQFNENSKAWSYFETVPEMNHNAMSGIHFPAEAVERLRVLFLQSPGLHPRNRIRLELAQQVLAGQGISCRDVPVEGTGKLAQILAAVQLGVDPTDIQDIVGLKEKMSGT